MRKKVQEPLYCQWKQVLPCFSDYEMDFPPQIWEKNGGASYSPNVAYLARYRISALKDAIKYFTTFFASKFFSLFSSSKTRCVLWSKKYGTYFLKNWPKNTHYSLGRQRNLLLLKDMPSADRIVCVEEHFQLRGWEGFD